MGWSYGWTTKKAMTESIMRPWETADCKVQFIAQCWRGNAWSGVHWAVCERTYTNGEVKRTVVCVLMQCSGGQWGYKDMSEDMGPYYYSCPLGYLALAQPEPTEGYAKEWRDKVRAYHAAKKTAKTQ